MPIFGAETRIYAPEKVRLFSNWAGWVDRRRELFHPAVSLPLGGGVKKCRYRLVFVNSVSTCCLRYCLSGVQALLALCGWDLKAVFGH